MDFNQYLLDTLMSYGHYDGKSIRRNELRVFLNKLCAYVCFFCGFKMIIIVMVPWNKIEIVLYLVEIYVVNSEIQKFFYLCVIFIHFAVGFAYIYWGYLNSDPKRMECLKFFFIQDIDELCKHYELELRPTKKFIKKANLYRRLMYIIIFGFEFSFFFLTVRCLIVAFYKIELEWFIFVSLPMAFVTFFSYHCVIIAILAAYLLALLTMDFLILRISAISKRLREKFSHLQNLKIQKTETRLVLLKDKSDFIKILRTINDILKQFHETNNIFDYMISIVFVNCMFGGLLFPAFLFIPFPLYFKVLSMFLYTLTIAFVCFFISVYNDNFINSIKILDSTIHHVMPKFEGYHLKSNLNNFLILNNEHTRLSFTYLHSFNYSTNSLIEYLVHSISLVFMIYQAIYLGPTTNFNVSIGLN